ncbi:MFS transporter [Nonomuraea cavernae]|uniref:MFS transporter n=1 Tax=Nonomuraea cavernae TaxID=2045107 RepID=A0A918DP01_9ACTN|nr:MFS transporter [Nonomuraea cavernae]MCA2189119.1 MFS transporter [Nonomuraea cavernae]GGO76220.1 MFS transporter [Nonomuraea cavernae]
MTHPTGARGRYRDALAVPEFRTLFLSHVLCMLGTIVTQFALTVLVYRQSGSPLLAALVFTVAFVPYLFGGVLLSALVDRVAIRRLLVGCNLLTAALAAAMTLPGLPVTVVLVLALGMGLVAPVFAGARAAMLPRVLDGDVYIAARSLFRLVAQGAQVSGFALGGLLLIVLTPRAALVINTGTFLLSAALLAAGLTARPAVSAPGTQSLVGDSLTGLGRIFRQVRLRRVLVFGWAVPALGVAPEALAAPYADLAGFGTAGLGLLMSALPIGTVLGELLCLWLPSPARRLRLIAPLALLVFLPQLLFGLRPGLPSAIALLVLSGIGLAHHLGLDQLLVDVAPEKLLGRALSVQTAGLMFWQGVGFAVAGAAAQFAAPSLVITVTAALGLALVPFLRPRRDDLANDDARRTAP